jgi:hypothetical protein
MEPGPNLTGKEIAVQGYLFGNSCKVVIDSGADGIFVSKKFLDSLENQPARIRNGGQIELADGTKIPNDG